MFSARILAIGVFFAPAAGCSDDGLPSQGQNSTSTTSDGDGGSLPTSDPGPDTGNATADGGSDGPPAETGDGTTADPGGTTGTTGATGAPEGSGSSTGDTEGSSSSTGDTEGSSSTGDMCMPITEDASDIGSPCQIDADCSPGYTCQTFVGFALDQTCQILCTQACECPMGLACTFTQDKVASWNQCTQ